MKKLGFILILLVFATAGMYAQEITFKTDTYNFGTINEGDSVSFEFTFTNTGKAPLILEDVTASCGCTTPYWPKQPIKPGQSSKINATFRSEGKSGEQNKMITIKSNATEPTKRIFFKGTVKAKQ